MREHTGVSDPHRAALGLDRLLRQHLWLKLCDTGVAPVILSEVSDPGTEAAKM